MRLGKAPRLNLAAPENLVLLAARALGAAKAAHQQDRYPRGHYESQQASARHEPVY